MVQGKAGVIDRAVRPTSGATNSEHALFRRHSREMQSRNSQILKLAPTKNTSELWYRTSTSNEWSHHTILPESYQ